MNDGKWLGFLGAGLGLLWVFAIGCGPVTEAPSAVGMDPTMPVDSVGHWLDRAHAEGRHAGAVIVFRDGRNLGSWFHGEERSGGEAVTERSAFRLASVSKQFTVAGILVAAEQGRLALDDDIRAYLLECPYEGVTVRHLLQHVSGIPDFYMDLPIPERGFLGIADVVAALPDAPTAQRKPGEDFEYSNTGYVLAAAILERVFGQSFEEAMKEHVFAPAGLECTRVWNLFSEDADFPHKTWSMDGVGAEAQEVLPTELDGVAGDGGVFMCAADVVHWNAWWSGNEMVSDSLRIQAFEPAILLSGDTSDYGLGWSIPDGEHVSHTGGWLGARTFWWRSLDGRDGVVVFNHTGSEQATAIGEALVESMW